MHNAMIAIPLFVLSMGVLAYTLVVMTGKQARRVMAAFTIAYFAFGIWCAFNVYKSDAKPSDLFFVANHSHQ